MFEHSIVFTNPKWLWLLLLLPLLWWFSYRSLAGLGKVRRILALTLRSVVLLLLILALAEAQYKRVSDRLTLIYVLDQSQSIPEDQRRLMIDYVNREVRQHRDASRGDRAGVIVFGRDAAIEHPPHEGDISLSQKIESQIQNDSTNLEGALRLAQASLPEDSAGRIVVICDGNENQGDAREQAGRLAAAGVGIDVLPIRYAARGEISVEKVALPSDVNRSQPFEMRVVLNNTADPRNSKSKPISGNLKIVRRTDDKEEVLQNEPVTVEPGKRVFTLREELDAPGSYTYDAIFTPQEKSQDALAQNNQATAFTFVRGHGQILFLENSESPNEFNFLIERLKSQNLEVQKRGTDRPILSLADLQPFDTVILGNVPREAFTDEQIDMLVQNTHQFGCGLIMLGGENSFGAGGWSHTELERAMPVDFQIKNAKVAPVGALSMVIDRSGSMSGDKLAMAIRAANAAVDVLSNNDYISVVSFDSDAYTVVPTQKVENRGAVKGRISRLTIGGGTNMAPGIQRGARALDTATQAAAKHMIILTDGQSMGENYPAMIRALRQKRVTVSTVAVGDDADLNLLAQMANEGGGRFYHAKSAKGLPRIFQQEARRVARPLIYEKGSTFPIRVTNSHEILKGIDQLPAISGFVMTTIKENPLVEVAAISTQPKTGEKYNTILASWQYGLGKSVAWTTDAGHRWGAGLQNRENYDKLFGQMVRWSMRPAGEQGKFNVSTDAVNGKVQVVITALDKDDEFLNFLNMGGNVVGPDMKPIDLKLRQAAPGRYTGEFDAPAAGSYFMMISPGGGMENLRCGVNVPYSAEYLDREPNDALLLDMAALKPEGSEPGIVIEDVAGVGADKQLTVDTFRHNLNKAFSNQDIWFLLVFAGACLFLGDVFNRRVTIDWSWAGAKLATAWSLVARKAREPQVIATMDRLRSRKAELNASLEEQRAGARFELDPEAETTSTIDRELAAPGVVVPRPAPARSAVTPDKKEEDDYTSRLLKAKRKVWDDTK